MRGCEKTSRFFITFSGLFRLVASFAQLSRTSSGSEKSSHIYRVEFSTFQTLIFTPSNFLPSPKHFPIFLRRHTELGCQSVYILLHNHLSTLTFWLFHLHSSKLSLCCNLSTWMGKPKPLKRETDRSISFRPGSRFSLLISKTLPFSIVPIFDFLSLSGLGVFTSHNEKRNIQNFPLPLPFRHSFKRALQR